MKKRVFIGSSTEALGDVDLIATWLEANGVDAVRWEDQFPLGEYTLPRLIEVTDDVDGAVLLFTPDDASWHRGVSVKQPRDNVILEYGIFVARPSVSKQQWFAIAMTRTGVRLAGFDGTRYIGGSSK